MVFAFQGIAFATNGDTIVYITKTGSKYHTSGCKSLRSSKIEVTLEQALAEGFEPCSLCNPPRLTDAPDELEAPAGLSLYRVNKEYLDSYKEAVLSKMVVATVKRVVDGDTIQVDIENPPQELAPSETIRLLGVDTPETVHPSKPVEYYGKEAGEFTRHRLEGQTVYLAFDWDLRDSYRRLLAYVYLQNGTCHNAAIIYEGYGFAYLTYPFQFSKEFFLLQREARESGIGLWRE